MFKKLMVIAAVVGAVGMNGCSQIPAGLAGMQQIARPLGAAPAAPRGGAAPRQLGGGNVLANLAQRPAPGAKSATPAAPGTVSAEEARRQAIDGSADNPAPPSTNVTAEEARRQEIDGSADNPGTSDQGFTPGPNAGDIPSVGNVG